MLTVRLPSTRGRPVLLAEGAKLNTCTLRSMLNMSGGSLYMVRSNASLVMVPCELHWRALITNRSKWAMFEIWTEKRLVSGKQLSFGLCLNTTRLKPKIHYIHDILIYHYHLQTKLQEGTVFRVVCLSTGWSLYDVTSCLPPWSHVPSRGLCLWSHVPSRRCLCPGGLCVGGLCLGGLCTHPTLECILVLYTSRISNYGWRQHNSEN